MGHGADATETRRYPGNLLSNVVSDITDEFFARKGRSRTDDRGAGLHHVSGDDARDASSRDDHVGGTSQRGHVMDAGVHDGHGGVAVRSAHRHQKSERSPDREAATDD